MELLDAMTEAEKTMAENYIDTYAMEDGVSRTVSIDYILRVWEQNKRNLFNMMDNQLILSKQIVFQKSEEILESEILDILGSMQGGTFVHDFAEAIGRSIERYGHMWHELMDLLSAPTLATNIYSGPSFEISFDGMDKPFKLNHGCRAIKAIGKICEALHIDGFEEFRVQHSMVLNQKQLKGNLCLSIHPLDFMTMSDNDCDWESCMSWQNLGCYRLGTVEMMNSPMVLVAYLTAADPMQMPDDFGDKYYWNNKKWRQLFIVNNNIITGIKGYPYQNDELVKIVLDWLKQLAETHNMGQYTDDIIHYNADESQYVPELGFEVFINPHTDYMYNDFRSDHFAYMNKTPDFVIDKADHYKYWFNYSGEAECMACGSTEDFHDDADTLLGSCCKASYFCECCQEYYMSDENFVEVDGEWICPECYDNECRQDVFTQEDHFVECMRDLYISFDGGKTVICTERKFYADDLDFNAMGRYISALYEGSVDWRHIYFINFDDMTEHGAEMFDCNSKNEVIEMYSHWRGIRVHDDSISVVFSENS